MSQNNIEKIFVDEGKLILSPNLLPKEWTAPSWVLWEIDEPYLTLFPSTPDSSTLESVAEYGTMEVVNGVVELPPCFMELLSDPNEIVTVKAEPQFVEIFGGRVWDALNGAFTSQEIFW